MPSWSRLLISRCRARRGQGGAEGDGLGDDDELEHRAGVLVPVLPLAFSAQRSRNAPSTSLRSISDVIINTILPLKCRSFGREIV